MPTQRTQRLILRGMHIVFGIPILGYIYSPIEQLPLYAGRVRFAAVPILLLTGLWMWKGFTFRQGGGGR